MQHCTVGLPLLKLAGRPLQACSLWQQECLASKSASAVRVQCGLPLTHTCRHSQQACSAGHSSKPFCFRAYKAAARLPQTGTSQQHAAGTTASWIALTPLHARPEDGFQVGALDLTTLHAGATQTNRRRPDLTLTPLHARPEGGFQVASLELVALRGLQLVVLCLQVCRVNKQCAE